MSSDLFRRRSKKLFNFHILKNSERGGGGHILDRVTHTEFSTFSRPCARITSKQMHLLRCSVPHIFFFAFPLVIDGIFFLKSILYVVQNRDRYLQYSGNESAKLPSTQAKIIHQCHHRRPRYRPHGAHRPGMTPRRILLCRSSS